jgi:hypothetical protein
LNAFVVDFQIAGLFHGIGIGDEIGSFLRADWIGEAEEEEKDEGQTVVANNLQQEIAHFRGHTGMPQSIGFKSKSE